MSPYNRQHRHSDEGDMVTYVSRTPRNSLLALSEGLPGAACHYGAVARVGGHRVGRPYYWGMRLATIMA
jgi:hypothetical protein